MGSVYETKQDNQSLELRSINDLLDKRFVVPSYQRGYRWTKRQVTELLDDIHAFQRARREQEASAFYCLQPVVVRAHKDGGWELIDGQQRLTTILLILKVLDPVVKFLRKSSYALTYETRPDSEAFIAAPDAARKDDNIDFHHLYEAFEAIQSWFNGKDGNVQLQFLDCLLEPEDRNVKVIWYELPTTENPIQVFVRLNVGKIPLTNAELIRALFLRASNFKDPSEAPSKYQIAAEWDATEKRLQDDSFWYFVHEGASPYPARIEYLFAIQVLRSAPLQDAGQLSQDAYGTFVSYQARFYNAHHGEADHRIVERLWREIRQLQLRLEEWYEDRTLYHLVGYLVSTARKPSTEVIVELLRDRAARTRSAFEAHLKARILSDLLGSMQIDDPEEIERQISEFTSQLSYTGGAKEGIRKTLLLFNVATLLRNMSSNLRFPFDLYKKQDWDIEHVKSVKSDKPGRPDFQKRWLRSLLDYWEATPEVEGWTEDEEGDKDGLRARAQDLVEAEPLDPSTFDALYEDVLRYFGEASSSEADHGLANLTLLDQATNRGFKNAVFPVKRARVLALDKEGTFAPLCTTNVYLKYYSSHIEQMMTWSERDGRDYKEAVDKMLTHFFVAGRSWENAISDQEVGLKAFDEDLDDDDSEEGTVPEPEVV